MALVCGWILLFLLGVTWMPPATIGITCYSCSGGPDNCVEGSPNLETETCKSYDQSCRKSINEERLPVWRGCHSGTSEGCRSVPAVAGGGVDCVCLTDLCNGPPSTPPPPTTSTTSKPDIGPGSGDQALECYSCWGEGNCEEAKTKVCPQAPGYNAFCIRTTDNGKVAQMDCGQAKVGSNPEMPNCEDPASPGEGETKFCYCTTQLCNADVHGDHRNGTGTGTMLTPRALGIGLSWIITVLIVFIGFLGC